ncbi:MAG: M1 family metallopeptidase [Bacteroidales bacterium]|nr:M1 family metallopeptidase [Bacteroidales bacterium]
MNFNRLTGRSYYDIMHLGAATYRTDQPVNLTSTDYSFANYGMMVYMKAGLSFHYLKSYLGQEEFDRIMKSFYEIWKFKHPQPEDLKGAFY